MFLYSQAVEYYNGINDDKQNSWQDKIQNMLLRPEILMTMQNASKDPDAEKKKQDKERERRMTMAPKELEKIQQEEAAKRKKERTARMNATTKI